MKSRRCRRLGTHLAVLIAVASLWVPSEPGAQGTLSALETDVDQIARNARPSVVTVITQRTVTRRKGRHGPNEKRIHTRVGSGVAVEESGILTTASVVFGAERVLVRTANGIQVDAELAGVDLIFNLALLRVPGVRLPTLRFSDQRSPQEGDWVMALGTSYGAQATQSVGTVAYRYREPRQSLIQLTNTVYPGNSGGAALNARGELIGIVQGELGSPDLGGRGPNSERRPSSMSFVLPVETIRPVYESLRTEGRVRHGHVGVSTRAAHVESATERGLHVPIGALVESVQPDGPGGRLGLRHGDLIVAFDNERVEYPEQLARWVSATPPGTTVEMVWVRNEIRHSGRVALTESPDPAPKWAMIGTSAPDETPASRIADLERQIQQLNRELQRLKSETGGAPR